MEPVERTNEVVAQPPDDDFKEEKCACKYSLFKFKNNQVRAMNKNGTIYFVACDVCIILDIHNTARALSRLDDDEKGITIVNTPGGNQQLSIITESGLYKLLFTSRKAEAKTFTRMVTHEILPALREHGIYATDPAIAAIQKDPSIIQKLLADSEAFKQKEREYEAKINDLKNKYSKQVRLRARYKLKIGPCVYLITTNNSDEDVKLGISMNANDRLKNHQSSCVDFKLQYICYLETKDYAKNVEDHLKLKYRNNINGHSTEHIHGIKVNSVIAAIRTYLTDVSFKYTEEDHIDKYNACLVRAAPNEDDDEGAEPEDTENTEDEVANTPSIPSTEQAPDVSAPEPQTAPTAEPEPVAAPEPVAVSNEASVAPSPDTCKKCGKAKTPADFYSSGRAKCKQCISEENKAKRRAENPERYAHQARNNELATAALKRCSRCKKEKPLNVFNNTAASRDGKATWCKTCMIEARKKNYEKVRKLIDPSLRMPTGHGVRYIKDGAESEPYASMTALERAIGVSRKLIAEHLKKGTPTENGYMFMAVEPNKHLYYTIGGTRHGPLKSLTAMASETNVCEIVIRRCISTGNEMRGYKFMYE